MGKKQKHHGSRGGNNNKSTDSLSSSSHHNSSSVEQQQQQQQQQQSPPTNSPPVSLFQTLEKWLRAEQQGIIWVLGCISLGCLFGFGIGSGWLTGGGGSTPSAISGVAPWRVELGTRIRSSIWYQLLFLWQALFYYYAGGTGHHDYYSGSSPSPLVEGGPLHPSHPRVFAVLREAVVREKDGYVHPDIGLLTPAPSGAARGLGMVRDSYHNCQSRCFPGVAKEKADLRRNQRTEQERNPENKTLWLPPIADQAVYKQEEVLVRVPLTFQMTRTVALDTLMTRLPNELQRKASPHELDDAALLVLLLAHERGVGRHSRWLPYIASLPKEPSCGYSPKLRPYVLHSINALQEELGVDTYGWKGELMKAHKHASRIAHGLAKDYGPHIKTPEGMKAVTNIEWALCQVTSRATAGSEQYGALRMVPLMDMINHDANAGGFVELTGNERLAHGDFVEAAEDDAGTFVVRSLRHGRRKALKKGQELLVNYNVPHYSPLDWFVSLGFVPPERQSQWQKIDAALPRVRQDSYGVGEKEDGSTSAPTAQVWKEDYGPEILAKYKEHQKKKKQLRSSNSSSGGSSESAGGGDGDNGGDNVDADDGDNGGEEADPREPEA